jgi:hypothetical protein
VAEGFRRILKIIGIVDGEVRRAGAAITAHSTERGPSGAWAAEADGAAASGGRRTATSGATAHPAAAR